MVIKIFLKILQSFVAIAIEMHIPSLIEIVPGISKENIQQMDRRQDSVF